MPIFNIPHFPKAIDTKNLEETYDGEITLNGKKVYLDLWLNNTSCKENLLYKVEDFIKNIEGYIHRATATIQKDFKNKMGTVYELIEDHIDQFSEEDHATLEIPNHLSKVDTINYVFNKVYLHRIGIYPESGSDFGVFDFTMSKEVTDYIFVVRTNQKGQITSEVEVES